MPNLAGILEIPSIYKVQREAMLPLCKRPGISCLTRIKSSYASVGLGKNLPMEFITFCNIIFESVNLREIFNPSLHHFNSHLIK